jgi:hypothetical protein
MGCNTSRQNCTPVSVFATAAPNCGQFLNPANFQAEQLVYDSAFKDLINNFGIPIDYYINTFNLSSADVLYGEEPTAVFYGPVSIMMYIELNESAINLSKFGFASDDELTGFVHIQTFEESMSGKDFFIQTANGDILQYGEYKGDNIQTEDSNDILTQFLENLITEQNSSSIFNDLIGGDYRAFNSFVNNGQSVEPKSGDLIQLSPLGCDRPNGRGAKIFEITERVDQDIASINPLLGHYVYRIRAKRYEHSFEPGAPREQKNEQVYENSFAGSLSSSIFEQVTSEPKSYPGDLDTESQTKVFNMDVNNTDIYGSYY